MILLIGATGKTGSLVARNLVTQGHRPRALVRDPRAAAARLGPGLDYIHGDLHDPASLRPALDGVDVAYLATAPSDLMVEQETTFIAAAQAAGLPRLVKLSVFGTDPEVPIWRWHSQIESTLTHSGIPATCLRPVAFMTTLLDTAETIKAGQLYSTAGDGQMAWIDTADVADVATTALLDPAYAGRILQLTGREAPTYDQLAATLTRVLGHPVEHVRLDDETFRAQLKGAGLPDWLSDSFVNLSSFIRHGKVAAVTPVIQDVLGRPARSLSQWIETNRSAFTSLPPPADTGKERR